MKRILLSFVSFINLAHANTINAIAVVVDKESIATYDIERTTKILNIPRNQALGTLINEKMGLSQIRQFGTYTSEPELDNVTGKMLAQNKISLEDFKRDLQAKGQNYEQFRSNFKKDFEKRKLYEKIASTAKTDFSDEEAKKSFEQNKNKFTLSTETNVNVYRSNSAQDLENVKATTKAVLKVEKATLTPNDSDPRSLGFLSSIPIGSFSPALNSQKGYEIYQVKDKNGGQTPEYYQIKNEIPSAYVSEQRQNYTQDYFDKLCSRINIEYLR